MAIEEKTKDELPADMANSYEIRTFNEGAASGVATEHDNAINDNFAQQQAHPLGKNQHHDLESGKGPQDGKSTCSCCRTKLKEA